MEEESAPTSLTWYDQSRRGMVGFGNRDMIGENEIRRLRLRVQYNS